MENSENNKNISTEDIKWFSIIEKDGKKLLSVVLQEGEKIELQISLHVRELYDILNMTNYEYARNVVAKLVEWTMQQINQQNEEREIAWQAWLNSPENKSKKDLIDMAHEYSGMEKFCEILTIHNEFSDIYQSDPSFDFKDFEDITKMNDLLKILDADKKWLLTSASKMLGMNIATESKYWRKDIITQEWVKEHLPVLEKLFKAFWRSAFSKEDPRPWDHLHEDEQRIKRFTWFNFTVDEKKEEDDSIESDKRIIKSHTELAKLDIKGEIERILGIGGMRDRRYEEWVADHHDRNISEESNKIINTTTEIYKKLQLLWLYYKNELYIKTKDWSIPFTGSGDTEKSLDGMLYYKQHQEKYREEYKFVIDRMYGDEKDVHLRFIDLKIEDLSYGALRDVFDLLGESWLAPAFSIILSNGLLPGLITWK